MDNAIFATYLIPNSRIAGLEKLFKKLSNKIAKGKTSADFAPELTVVKEVIMAQNGHSIMKHVPGVQLGPGTSLVAYSWVTIMYSKPALNGWKLLAVYDWETTPDGKRTCYVSNVPNEIVPPEYREIESGECDHCQTNRRRNKSMLLTKDYIEFKVVGSSCIKDFLGHQNPNTLMDLYKFEASIQEAYDYRGSPIEEYYDIRTILSLSAMFVRMYGYVKVNDFDRQPTSYAISSYLHPYSKEEIEFVNNNKPNSSDYEKAENIINWVPTQSSNNDYINNVQKCVEAGAITSKRIGVLCSIVSSYNRAMERAIENDKPKSNNHLGAVKERLRGILAVVKRVRYTEGQYGTTSIITLTTGSGDTLVWFASGYLDPEQGDLWKFDGTVKKHDEFNGINQTVITRVKYQPQHSEAQSATA